MRRALELHGCLEAAADGGMVPAWMTSLAVRPAQLRVAQHRRPGDRAAGRGLETRRFQILFNQLVESFLGSR
jgi:hypothetical protein